ncbi:hypothetical protein M0R45_014824 [Rubus argutus]|uniref:Uncharacterized protein n=1 Tax=Rubus argutus TaxID=59490 RepID=A0AAW1XNA8_RUBAR
MVKRCCYQYYYCIGGSHGFLPGAKGWLWSWAFFRIWAYSGPLSPRKSNGDVAAPGIEVVGKHRWTEQREIRERRSSPERVGLRNGLGRKRLEMVAVPNRETGKSRAIKNEERELDRVRRKGRLTMRVKEEEEE